MKPKQLSNLEQEVMDIAWQFKGCSVREVVEKIQPTRKLAYTTIATILQRLYEKGMLARKEEKNGYVYSPKISKEKYSQNIARSFIKNFINSFGDVAIASFADGIDKLPEAKRKYFLKLLKNYGK